MKSLHKEITLIAKPTFIIFLARIGGILSGIGLMVVMAWTLEANEMGVVLKCISFAMLLSLITTFNIGSGSLRFITEYLGNDQLSNLKGFLQTGFTINNIFLFSILTFLTCSFLLFPNYRSELTSNPYVLSIIAAPILGRIFLTNSHLHAYGYVLTSVLPMSFFRPLIFLALLGTCYLIGIDYSPIFVLWLFIFTLIAMYLIQSLITPDALTVKNIANDSDFNHKSIWLTVGLQIVLPLLFIQYFTDVIIVVSSTILNDHQIALLGIELRIIGFVTYGIAAINMSISPKVARAISNSNIKYVESIMTLSGVLKLIIALGGMLIFTYYGNSILSIFGNQYVIGHHSLVTLSSIPVIMALFGPTQMLSTVLKLQHYTLLIFLIALIILITSINYYGALYGLTGVSYSVSGVWLFWNLSLHLCIRVKSSYDSSIFSVISIYKLLSPQTDNKLQ